MIINVSRLQEYIYNKIAYHKYINISTSYKYMQAHPHHGNLHLPSSHQVAHKPHNLQPHPHNDHPSHQHQHVDYNSFQAEDGNVVWAGALTLAWKELLHLAKAKNFTIDKHQGDLQKIADNFNYNPFSTKDLNPNSYYVKSGYGQQTVDLINKQRGDKFKECTFDPVNANLSPSAIISYAYLYKKVMYPYKFTKRQGKVFTFHSKNESKQVQSFYAEDNEQFKQVQIYEYINKNEFAVALKDAADHDQIFLYKAPQHLTVKDVIAHINKLSEKSKNDLEFIMQSDQFQVPILNLDYNRTLNELCGVGLQEFPGYTIEQIMQGVKLKLDENGAIVENEGMMIMDECAIWNPDPRTLKLDSPFWVVMKEKGRHPYLCVKINNI